MLGMLICMGAALLMALIVFGMAYLSHEAVSPPEEWYK